MVEPPEMLFPSKSEWRPLFAVVCVAMAVACACNSLANYFSSTSSTPSNSFSTSFDPSLTVNGLAETGNEESQHNKLECAKGFRKFDNLWVKEDDIEALTNKLSRIVKNHVCESHAQFLCHGSGRVWIEEETLLRELHQKLDDTAILRNMSLQTIGGFLEERTNAKGEKELKCPEILAMRYESYSCQIRKWVFERATVIITSCFTALGLVLVGVKLKTKWDLESRSDEAYEHICLILEENALASRTKSGEHEAWVVASFLRDHLLSPKERKNLLLWNKVVQMVQEDSRIDVFHNIVKGESKIVWEWQVEGSLICKRVRNARAVNDRSSEESETTPQKYLLE